MDVTADLVAAEREAMRDAAPTVVPLTNRVRDELGERFGTDVDPVTAADYRSAVDRAFDDPDRAINLAALSALLRDLDVAGDYPGFVVDEVLGRELAATVAGEQPLRLLAEATFHYADTMQHGDASETNERSPEPAGLDDWEAALAAGFQTRLPGWDWREGPGPFDE